MPAAPWPTTEFELVEATPRSDVVDDYLLNPVQVNPVQELLPGELDDVPVKKEMEDYLHRAALEYVRLGLAGAACARSWNRRREIRRL